jgi:hypothetical protein
MQHQEVRRAVPTSGGNRRIRQFRNGAARELSAGLAALARSAAQQPVSSIELQAVSATDIRAEVRTAVARPASGRNGRLFTGSARADIRLTDTLPKPGS